MVDAYERLFGGLVGVNIPSTDDAEPIPVWVIPEARVTASGPNGCWKRPEAG